jgi:insulin-like growth factor 2 mRNA-binding protein 1
METVYVYVPSVFFNVVFGLRGANIPAMSQISKATIKICRGSERETEVAVQITGSSEAQWKAQLDIFRRLKEEGMAIGGDVRLTVEMLFPFTQLEKLTGRGNTMIRDIQTQTGAMINIPRVVTDNGEIPVQIYGTYQASQSAQQRLRALLSHRSSSSSPPPVSPPQKYISKPVIPLTSFSSFPASTLNPWAAEFQFPMLDSSASLK